MGGHPAPFFHTLLQVEEEYLFVVEPSPDVEVPLDSRGGGRTCSVDTYLSLDTKNLASTLRSGEGARRATREKAGGCYCMRRNGKGARQAGA